jgi:hypothetical protein
VVHLARKFKHIFAQIQKNFQFLFLYVTFFKFQKNKLVNEHALIDLAYEFEKKVFNQTNFFEGVANTKLILLIPKQKL